METKAVGSARDVVLSFLAALNKDDFTEARNFVHDQFSFVGVLGRRDGAEDYFRDMEKMKLKYHIQKVWADRDDVCVLYDIDMGGGKKVFASGWYKVKQNKIESFRVVFDPRPVMQHDELGFRYIVNDVDAAVNFYTEMLGFKLDMKAGGGFAMLTRDGMHLFLNKPGAGGAGTTLNDGSVPEPGGWNRIQLQVKDLDRMVAELKSKQAKFRNDMIEGVGGKQILLQDPSGNLVELFEPKKQ
jgi:catechol 2,3-dioxygenase-like lactoylglutathione lyase family enzyme